MPEPWNEKLEAHRREIREAIMETTAALVFEHGLASVTMTSIAEETGIGRATLYKYFPDVEAIVHAWHGRQITNHLGQLTEVRDQESGPVQRLNAVLQAFASIAHRSSHGHRDAEVVAFMHRDEQVDRAQQQLRGMIRDLLADASQSGAIRNDVPPDELAIYCINALATASGLSSQAAVRRLVAVVLAGLHRPP